mmetsp:Transcript_55068/g.130111  ORF Transcript_55068/g.130111 Transcript_55068/m.130111 type:complete len:131 (-) Transcript_55068:68-460(-)
MPSAIGYTTARALASIYSHLATHRRIAPTADKGAFAECVGVAVSGRDAVLQCETSFANGGFALDKTHPSVFFHAGYGGSLGLGDTAYGGVGVAYVTNTLDGVGSGRLHRQKSLLAAIQTSLDKTRGHSRL